MWEQQIRQVFEQTEDIVDVDDSIETESPQIIIHIDHAKAMQLGVSQDSIVKAISTVLNGEDVGYIHDYKVKYPIPIRLEYTQSNRADLEAIENLSLRAQNGHLVPLAELVNIEQSWQEKTIYHKDLLAVSYVTGDMVGPPLWHV